MSRQTPEVCTQPGALCSYLMSPFKKTLRHIKHKLSVKWVFNSLVKLEKGLLASTSCRFHPGKKNLYIGYCKLYCTLCQSPTSREESVYNCFTGAGGMQGGIPGGLKIMMLKWAKGAICFKNWDLNCSYSDLRMPLA